MSKHTPGPWHVADMIGKEEDETDFRLCFHAIKAGDEFVSSTWAGPHIANARLIAAAPELLDALIHIEEYWNRDQNDTAMSDALWHIIDVAQEAIAKARGEV